MTVITETHTRNAELAREYLEWQRFRRNRAKETMVAYTDVLYKLLTWVDDIQWAAVPVQTLEAFVERPRVRRRPEHVRGQTIMGAPATRKRDVTVIRSFYRYLSDRGHIGKNPAVLLTSPTVNNVQPKAIDDDLWMSFWSHPALTVADRVAFGLGYFCGLRRAEMVDLKVSHIDVEGSRLVGFTRKGGLQDTFAVGSAVNLIHEHLPALVGGDVQTILEPLHELISERPSEGYLLPWGDGLGRDDDPHLRGVRKDPYPPGWAPPNTVNKRLRTALRRIGLDELSFSVHSLRHSAITNWLRCGVPLHVASRLAAHADVTTTMRYVRLTEDPLGDMLDRSLVDRPSRWI